MRPTKRLLLVAALALAASAFAPVPAAGAKPAWTWYEVDEDGEVRVNLYFFYSATCPHCAKATAFLRGLQDRCPWLQVKRYETTGNSANLAFYRRMAASLQRPAGQVPAFFYCQKLEIGYDSYDQNGRRIERGLVRCHDALRRRQKERGEGEVLAPGFRGLPPLVAMVVLLQAEPEPPADENADPAPPDLPVDLPPEDTTVTVPLWGEVEAADLSLPAITLVMAGCDSFNPCAFFVLLFLLSLLVHGRSRPRMLLVGSTFVLFSGLMYFLFMAAWLNLFFLVGHLRAITLAAGLVAVAVAIVNIKDYFWFKRGVSLSIPEAVKPGLYQRMTGLLRTSSFPSLLAGSAVLAVVANTYELLCTSGFPLVYTRVLTLRELPAAGYYLYLGLYNLIYVAPLALIVVVFTLTLGRRKLTEGEGRSLKLLSGSMMLVMGVLLVIRPESLATVVGAVGTLAAAIGFTGLVIALGWLRDRWGRPTPADEPSQVSI